MDTQIPAFPGLLRRCSPVLFDEDLPGSWHGDSGVVVMAYEGGATVLVGADGGIGECRVPRLSLDLSDPTGRLHARLYLAEQGHETSEDRPEVLAWSVESVRRGSGLLLGVAGPWRECLVMGKPGKSSTTRWERYMGASSTPRVCDAHGWRWSSFRGIEAGDTGKALCDAALLARNLALTNNDGSLTLPPLPEVSRG